MGFGFAETMSGWLSLASAGQAEYPDATEERYPFHFRVRVTAPSLWNHLRDGQAQVAGVVHAPPFCEAADATGTMLIRPVGARLIRYQLTFKDARGRSLRFAGQKNLSYVALRRTVTELDGGLRDDQGALMATTHLRFDLRRDWLSFARSFHRVK